MTALPWRDIDTVLLDMDGTLLDLHFDNHFWMEHLPQRYAELHGVSRAMAEMELQPLFERNAGQLQWYCLDFWSTEPLYLSRTGERLRFASTLPALLKGGDINPMLGHHPAPDFS